jgi:DNA polymerase III subunit epsilon
MFSLLSQDNKYNISQYLKLDRPLVIFDTETTGLIMSMDRIIELGYIKIDNDGRITKDDLYLNPEMAISEESMAVHGITDEQVKDKPTFRDKAKDLWEIFRDCYYGGFNVIDFDLPILKREFLRAGIDFTYTKDDIIDSKQIFHYMEPRTLSAAYKFYCGKEHTDAHNALADVEASAEVLVKQLEKYKEARDLNFLRDLNKVDSSKWVDNDRKFYWRSGQAYFAFSKHKDEPLSKVAEFDRDFLKWILSADFSEETKLIIEQALDGKFPEKKL